MKKKIGLLLAALLTATLSLGLVACGLPHFAAGTGSSAYVALDINPSVELVVENGVVVSVRGLNYDARVMLYESDGIVGATPAEASQVIAELALRYGYVSADNSEIGLTVSGADEESEKKIFAEVSASVTAAALAGGVTVTVGEDTGASIERELEELKAAHPDNAAIRYLTLKRYRMIKAALDADETLTVEAAAALDFDELKDIIEDAYEADGEYLGDAFELAVERAKLVYRETTEPLLDAAYVTVDPINGAKYVALRAAYRTLDGIGEIDEELAEMTAITADDLNHVAGLLGFDAERTQAFAAAVTDGNGRIDEDSIEYYLDKLERNYKDKTENAREEFEDILDEIEDYLDEAEDRAETLTAELAAKAAGAVAGVREYFGGHAENFATFDEVEDAAEAIEEEIERLEEYFDEHLTASQKEQVKEAQKAVADQLAAAESAFEKAVEDAKKEIVAALAQAQEKRLEIKVKA